MVQKSDASAESERQSARSSSEDAVSVDLRNRSSNDAYARMVQVRELPGGFPRDMEIGSAASTMLEAQMPGLDKSTMRNPTIYTYRFDSVTVDVVQSKLTDGSRVNRQETPSRDGTEKSVTLTYSRPQQLTLGKDNNRHSIEDVSTLHVSSNRDGSYQISALYRNRDLGLPMYRHFNVAADGTVKERLPSGTVGRKPTSILGAARA